jgi:hypothetical protein
MRHLALLFLVFSGMSLAADRPACFDGPVTKGAVTVSCKEIDNTANPAIMSADPGLFPGQVPNYLLAVRVVSTDPDVIGFRITVAYDGQAGGPAEQSGIAIIPPSSIPPPVPVTYIVAPQGMTWPAKITAVKVQPIKAGSVDSF